MSLQEQVHVPEADTWVGKALPRIDTGIKVTGRARYTRDMKLDRMLFAKVKRCPHPHALIRRIDVSKAKQMPGVRAVVTGENFRLPTNEDTPALAYREVLYASQAVAAVAAESPLMAQAALDRIEIEYEELPYVTDPEVSMSGSSPCRIRHPGEESKPPNLGAHLKVRQGDVDGAFGRADHVIEGRYTTPMESHFQLEPVTFLAQPDNDGGVTVWGTAQGATKLQLEIAWLLGLDTYRVRVKVPLLGGWFGAKDEGHLAAVCARLALDSIRPVKLELSREESMNATGVRHPSVIYVKDGVARDGKILAREIKAIYNGGAYGALGNVLIKRAILAAVSVYNIENLKIDAYRVYTDLVPGVPKRGPFGFQMVWAIEGQTERDAETVGIDPVEFRLRNLFRDGQRNATNDVMENISHERALFEVVKAIRYGLKDPAAGPWRRGKGVAVAAKWAGGGPYQAMVRLRENGKVEVWAAAVENGQGILTGLVQVAATEMRVRPEDVIMQAFVDGADSASMGVAEGASASRQMVNVGNAVLHACHDLKRRVGELAAPRLGVPAQRLELRGTRIVCLDDASKAMNVMDLFVKASRASYGAGGYLSESGEAVGYGSVNKKEAPLDPETGKVTGDGRASPYYVSVAQGADVSVNVETGEVRVHRIAAAHDVGRAINPEIVRNQIIGSVSMGLSSALSEDMVIQGGHVANTNLADYKLQSSEDATLIEPIVIENPYRDGPYGAKSVGEPSTLPTPAAVRNAIHDAVGVWIDELPMTRERVLDAIAGRAGKRDI